MTMKKLVHLAAFAAAFLLFALPGSPGANIVPTVGEDVEAQNPQRWEEEGPGGCSDTFWGCWTDRNGHACLPKSGDNGCRFDYEESHRWDVTDPDDLDGDGIYIDRHDNRGNSVRPLGSNETGQCPSGYRSDVVNTMHGDMFVCVDPIDDFQECMAEVVAPWTLVAAPAGAAPYVAASGTMLCNSVHPSN